MIDLQPDELKIVQEILRRFLPACEVRAFGSRVSMTAKQYSDLDLVIIDEEQLDFVTLAEVKDAFIESDLPFRVDLLDWSRINAEFKAVIEQEYQVLQDSREGTR